MEISSQLLAQIKFEEGGRSTAYICPAGKKTIGYGHNLDANPYFEGNLIPDVIDEGFAEILLEHDLQRTVRGLEDAWHGYELLPPPRQDAVINMAFQLGVNGFMKFKKTRDYLIRCDWIKAADEAMNSDWARHDSPSRAKRVARQIATGTYYPAPAAPFE